MTFLRVRRGGHRPGLGVPGTALAVALLALAAIVLLGLAPSTAWAFNLSGKVSSEDGQPLQEIEISVNGPGGVKSTITGAEGGYSIGNLTAGDYTIRTRNTKGYVDEWCSNDPCYTDYSGNNAPVILSLKDATDINFVLSLGRTISGKVTREEDGLALRDVMRVVNPPGISDPPSNLDMLDMYSYVFSAADRNYVIRGLPPGVYKVRTGNAFALYWLDEWYDNVPVVHHLYTAHLATPIDVTEKNAVDINFLLDPGRTISGKVTADGGGPISGVCIFLNTPAGGEVSGLGKSRVDGTYEIKGLPHMRLAVWTFSFAYADE